MLYLAFIDELFLQLKAGYTLPQF